MDVVSKNEINFILPGMYEKIDLNLFFLKLLKDNPSYFKKDVKIKSVYGNFQFCIFDGGRIFQQYHHACKEDIEEYLYKYNEIYKVAVRFIFTNPIIKKEYFTDRFCNLILKLGENDLNEIVVNNEDLQKYIQDKYPKYKFISSTTKCLNNINDFKQELNKDKYFMVCLDYNLNHNKKLLESLSQQEKEKCEFLVNAICPSGCPFRKEHYRLNGAFSLTYGKKYSLPGCSIFGNTLLPKDKTHINNIEPEELFDYYSKNGFKYFKLEGRTLSTMENICNYTKYMIKPEYQFYVINLASQFIKL